MFKGVVLFISVCWVTEVHESANLWETSSLKLCSFVIVYHGWPFYAGCDLCYCTNAVNHLFILNKFTDTTV